MLQITQSDRYSGKGLVAKRNSQNFNEVNEHGAATCPFNCRAISKSFLDTLSEMAPMSEKKHRVHQQQIKCITLQHLAAEISKFEKQAFTIKLKRVILLMGSPYCYRPSMMSQLQLSIMMVDSTLNRLMSILKLGMGN